MSENKKIIKNNTKAFNYNYSSLADIAEQGFDIPKTRVVPKFTPDGTTFIGNYMEYLDDDGEWVSGIPFPDAKDLEMGGKANICQKLGSISTYCRRYCTLEYNQLACQDDQELETKAPVARSQSRIDFNEVKQKLSTILTTDQLDEYWKTLKPSTQKQVDALTKMFKERKDYLGGLN